MWKNENKIRTIINSENILFYLGIGYKCLIGKTTASIYLLVLVVVKEPKVNSE